MHFVNHNFIQNLHLGALKPTHHDDISQYIQRVKKTKPSTLYVMTKFHQIHQTCQASKNELWHLLWLAFYCTWAVSDIFCSWCEFPHWQCLIVQWGTAYIYIRVSDFHLSPDSRYYFYPLECLSKGQLLSHSDKYILRKKPQSIYRCVLSIAIYRIALPVSWCVLLRQILAINTPKCVCVLLLCSFWTSVNVLLCCSLKKPRKATDFPCFQSFSVKLSFPLQQYFIAM